MMDLKVQSMDVEEKSVEFSESVIELLVKYRLEIKEFPLNDKYCYDVAKTFWNDIASKIYKEGYVISAVNCAKIWKVIYEQYVDYVDNNATNAINSKYLNVFKTIDGALKGKQTLISNSTCIIKNATTHNFNSLYDNNWKVNSKTDTNIIIKRTERSLEPVSSNDAMINETENAVNSIRTLSMNGLEHNNSNISHVNFNYLNEESGIAIYNNWITNQILKWNHYTKSTETYFVWDNDSFQCFMDLGLHVEKLLRTGKTFCDHPYTYISSKMCLYGYMISSEECEKKWKELAILYGEHLDIIKTSGILESDWKKFWQMDKVLQESKLNTVMGPLSFIWTRNAIVYLINIRLEADTISNAKVQGYAELWQYVASKMTNSSFPFTCNECSIKWMELCETYEESLKRVSERDLNVNWDVFLSMHLGYMKVASNVKQMIKHYTPIFQNVFNAKSTSSQSSPAAMNCDLNQIRNTGNTRNSYEANTYFTNNTEDNVHVKDSGVATKRKSLIASDMVVVEMKDKADNSGKSQEVSNSDSTEIKKQKTSFSELSFIMKKSLSEQEKNIQMADTLSLPDSMNNNLTINSEHRTLIDNIKTQVCKDQDMNVQTSMEQNDSSVIEDDLSNDTLPLNLDITENNNYHPQEQDNANSQNFTNTREKGRKSTTNLRINPRVEEESVTFNWTENAMILLTRFRLEWEFEFQILHTNRYNVWHDVARAMKSLNHNVSSFLCESCWKHMIHVYYSQYSNCNLPICSGYNKCFKIINDALLAGIYNLESPETHLDAIFPKLGRAKSFWTDEAIKALIKLRFSEESPKIGTMTWVTMKMQNMGYRSLTFAQCCRKWQNLYATYKNMHIRLCQGKVINWPYFNIIDWYLKQSGKDLRSQILNIDATGHFVWSNAAVQHLIDGVLLLQNSSNESQLNLSDVHWKHIANALNARNFPVTQQDCADKWNSLIDEYKKTIHELRKGNDIILKKHFTLLNKWMENNQP